MNRKKAIKHLLVGGAGLWALPAVGGAVAPSPSPKEVASPNTFKQSVCRWCFDKYSLEVMCQQVKTLGLGAIDLCGPKDWATLQRYQLDSSMCNGAEISLTEGFNDTQYHEELWKRYTELIPLVAKNKYKNLICFSGNTRGMDKAVGMENMKKGIEKLLPLAEKHKVTLCLEMLNTKVNHPDYMANTVEWGVSLAEKIASPHFKLLFDIYHIQVEEGNIIDNIRKAAHYTAHYHTAGVPGRHELNNQQRQELFYPAIFQAINETKFDGYVAHEFLPTYADEWSSLREAIQLTNNQVIKSI